MVSSWMMRIPEYRPVTGGMKLEVIVHAWAPKVASTKPVYIPYTHSDVDPLELGGP